MGWMEIVGCRAMWMRHKNRPLVLLEGSAKTREDTVWLSECSYEYKEVTWQRWGESEKVDNARGGEFRSSLTISPTNLQ
jgi:hypothetical protein